VARVRRERTAPTVSVISVYGFRPPSLSNDRPRYAHAGVAMRRAQPLTEFRALALMGANVDALSLRLGVGARATGVEGGGGAGVDRDFSTKVIVGGQFPALRQLPQYRS